MSARDDIAEAANSSGLVKVEPFYRQSLKPFEGFVKWAGQVPSANGFGFVATWQIWIALPQDVVAAEKWLESDLGLLLRALRDELVLTSVQPAELVLGTNSVNGLIIEGSRGAGT